MAHIYEVGTRAWQPDTTDGWVASEVKEKLVDGEKVQLVFELENGEVGIWFIHAEGHLRGLVDGAELTTNGIIDQDRRYHPGRVAG